MGRATAFIDIYAIRLIIYGNNPRSQAAPQFRPYIICSSVGAVHNYPQAIEIFIKTVAVHKVSEIVIFSFLHLISPPHIGTPGTGKLPGSVQHQLLNIRFHFIRQLITTGAKKFNTVISYRIMGRGYYHTARCLIIAGEISYGRSRYHTYLENIRSGRAYAGLQSGFQHIAGYAGIFPHQYPWAGSGFLFSQGITSSPSQVKCHFGCQLNISYSPHSISSK